MYMRVRSIKTRASSGIKRSDGLIRRHAINELDVPETRRQDESQLTFHRFLVVLHGVQQRLTVEVRDGDRQSQGEQEVVLSPSSILVDST